MSRKTPETILSNKSEARDLSAEYFADGYPNPDQFLEILEENNPELTETYQSVLKISEKIRSEGGQALLVGGSVRDYYCGLVPKDYDLEVYRLDPEELKELLAEFGEVDEVGISFGILKVTIENGDVLDISVPRSESKIAAGHKGFAITADPNLSIEQAAKRRDFTINSLAANPLTGEVYNYFGGLQDLKDRVLRVTDPETFKDDSLRVLRGAQFVARLDLSVTPESLEVMRETVPALGEQPRVRFLEEWSKLLIKGFRPSRGLELLKDLGVFEQSHPELEVLAELPQEPKWHPEGDVWTHTKMVVDAASEHLNDFSLTEEQKRSVMLAALCHDLGKVTATKIIEAENRITSAGHEEAGVEPTKKFLASIGLDPGNKEFETIIKLVSEHMSPSLLYASRFDEHDAPVRAAADGAIRRLAKRIHPATIRELVALATADNVGRGPFVDENNQLLLNLYPAGEWIVREAEKLNVDKEPPKSLLNAKSDLLILGFKPGKNIGQVMKLADQLRDGLNLTKDEVLREIIIAKPDGVNSNQDELDIIAALEKLSQTE